MLTMTPPLEIGVRDLVFNYVEPLPRQYSSVTKMVSSNLACGECEHKELNQSLTACEWSWGMGFYECDYFCDTCFLRKRLEGGV